MASGTVPVGLRCTFPFTAVVGHDKVKKAILCGLVSNSINAILLRGPAGTAKTTLARAMDGLVQGQRVVNLPLNSTEDQIVGGLDFEAALRTGEKKALPGILQRADGNILYIDGINLLPERLVHLVLDAGNRQINLVEREGVSWKHECRFLLIGTMDPEEGELSSHMMDRFDICVTVSASDSVEERMEVLRRGLRYEKEPIDFLKEFLADEEELRTSVRMARERAPYMIIPSGHLDAIAELCRDLGVEGHRGDIALARTASALAALEGRDQVILEDLQEAVPLCLEHRRNDAPQEQADETPPPPRQNDEPSPSQPPEREDKDDDQRPPSEEMEPPVPPSRQDASVKDQVFSVGRSFMVIDYLGDEKRMKSRTSGHGRRDRTITSDRSGRYTRFQIPQGRIRDLAFDASIRAAAPYQRTRYRNGLAVVLDPSDLREKVRERKRGTRVLFLVDGSGSMGAHQRMVAVKGAILALLQDAYQKRDEVGMIAFRKNDAEVMLPLTRSVDLAYRKLEQMPTGGRTPLALGLSKGYELLLRDRSCGPWDRPVMVILTDGRANVPMGDGDAFQEALSMAQKMAGSGIRFVVVDTGSSLPRMDRAIRLCKALEGTYFQLEELDAGYLASSVRAIMRR